MANKLKRSSDKVLAGVCGGIANYFGWDAAYRAYYKTADKAKPALSITCFNVRECAGTFDTWLGRPQAAVIAILCTAGICPHHILVEMRRTAITCVLGPFSLL